MIYIGWIYEVHPSSSIQKPVGPCKNLPRPAQCLLVYGLGRGEDPLAKIFGAWPLPWRSCEAGEVAVRNNKSIRSLLGNQGVLLDFMGILWGFIGVLR